METKTKILNRSPEFGDPDLRGVAYGSGLKGSGLKAQGLWFHSWDGRPSFLSNTLLSNIAVLKTVRRGQLHSEEL